ncbi:MAG TPA: GGDEF domain-containing protein [Blastocatellia bacterium]|nr:GGDEF domain-containing protein [Blastocatellia bacterium]
MESVTGLTIQISGIALIAVLSFFLTRSIRRTFLDYWTAAWSCLAVALLSLGIGFHFSDFRFPLYGLYFFLEYAFGLLLIAGCQNYATGVSISRRHLYALAAAVALPCLLLRISKSFDVLLIPHAAIVAGLYAWAFKSLGASRRQEKPSPGLRVVRLALALLALDFAHYVVLLAYVRVNTRVLPLAYLRYTSIYDLILELLLGFGMVMLVMDHAIREVEDANRELIEARDRLEVLARIDPLTEALNRHAFYSLMDASRGSVDQDASGCAVVLDIDNLKPINDSLGHAAGDEAIRRVAVAIRSVIRSDDLLFRWGGDEFLILLFNISESAAHARVTEIDASLARTRLPGLEEPVSLIVSYGLSAFSVLSDLEAAIHEADGAMYARKQSRKAG